MESAYQRRPELLRLMAICEWLMVLPATIFLAAVALRLLQPREYEPARTSWILFDWTMTHVPRLGAAFLFIVMPGVAVAAGCAVLARGWQREQSLRQDSAMVLAIPWRHLPVGLLTAAMLLAGTIPAAVGVHILRD